MTAQICGVLDLGGGVDPAQLTQRMAEDLARPTGGRFELLADGPFALAQIARHQRPSIARQGQQHLVGNLDLVYRTEAPISERLDASTVLSVLEDDPQKTAHRIDGEYALAHWDGARSGLTLIRDRMGTRPLYYAHQPGAWFAFASAPGALCATGLVTARPCPEITAMIAIGNFAHGSRTQLQGIDRVMPAETLCVTNSMLNRSRYWELACTDPVAPGGDYEAEVLAMREVLDRAVRRRLPKEGPAFSHLSGGLDSSAISGLAARALHPDGRALVAYAFYPREGAPLNAQIDERPEVEAVTRAWRNIDLRPIDGDHYALLPTAPMDSCFPIFLSEREQYTQILSDAAASGARTVFSGFGGDQGVSHHGTHALAEMFVRGHWCTLWRLAGLRAGRTGRRRWRVVARDVFQVALPEWARAGVTRLVPRLAPVPNPFHRFIRPDLQDVAETGTLRLGWDTRQNRAQMLGWGHLTHVLEDISWRAAQHGLSYTLPLLDREVLEFMIRLPGAFFMQGGRNRTLLRDAMVDVLPESVRERPFKLIPDPGKVIRVSTERDRYRGVVDALRGTRAETVFDLDMIAAAIDGMPSPVELVARTESLAAKSVQYAATDLDFLAPLVQARFLAGMRSAPAPRQNDG